MVVEVALLHQLEDYLFKIGHELLFRDHGVLFVVSRSMAHEHWSQVVLPKGRGSDCEQKTILQEDLLRCLILHENCMQFVVEDGQLLDVYFWSRFVKYLISVIVDENLLAFRQLRKDVVFHLV